MKQAQQFPLVIYRPIQVRNGQIHPVENPVCQELPLEIRINDISYARIMRTPGLEKELAVGFCFTDDTIRTADDITEMTCTSAQEAPYITSVALTIPSLLGKNFKHDSPLKSSSGSVNRAQILDDILHRVAPIQSKKTFELSVLRELPEKLNACQVLRSKCGATHGSALFTQHGETLFCAEDVGRHNGLDKLIGHILLNKIDTNDKLLMLSSRASFEMIQKAVRIAIPVVASVSAPTDLALNVADKLQCTYVSFLTRGTYFIYTHPWRFGLNNI